MTLPRSSVALLALAAVLLALGAFLAWAAARPMALVYGIVGAAIAVGLALYFRKNRFAPVIVPREEQP